MAADLGINLDTIQGSGDHGKITKEDVRRASSTNGGSPAAVKIEPAPKAVPAAKPAPAPTAEPATTPAAPEPAPKSAPTPPTMYWKVPS
ncbi:MAG: E3 binding domain-containing protein [Anaerolineales bacterium]|nr:E3 binding domain-containing protein [Anaerolineales bacterium]